MSVGRGSPRLLVGMVSVRVDDQTRRKMGRFSHVNWSDVLRNAIEIARSQEERQPG